MHSQPSSQNIKEDCNTFWFHSSPPKGRLGAPSQDSPTILSHRSSEGILELGVSRNFGDEELFNSSQKTCNPFDSNHIPQESMLDSHNCNSIHIASLSPSSTVLDSKGHTQSQVHRSRRSRDATERRAAHRIKQRRERRIQYRQWRSELRSRLHKIHKAGRTKDTCMPTHTSSYGLADTPPDSKGTTHSPHSLKPTRSTQTTLPFIFLNQVHPQHVTPSTHTQPTTHRQPSTPQEQLNSNPSIQRAAQFSTQPSNPPQQPLPPSFTPQPKHSTNNPSTAHHPPTPSHKTKKGYKMLNPKPWPNNPTPTPPPKSSSTPLSTTQHPPNKSLTHRGKHNLLATHFKPTTQVIQNTSTPNHCRLQHNPHTIQSHTNPPTPKSRADWLQAHNTHTKAHTRAHWFKTHVLHPGTTNRSHHDIKIPTKHQLHIGCWNPTGLREGGKMHTLIKHMKDNKLDILVLPETHLTAPDMYTIMGYTIFHSADTSPTPQPYTGISIITAPYITPSITDLRPINGRFLTVTLKTAEAPLRIIAAYMPHNDRPQEERNDAWNTLSQLLTTTIPTVSHPTPTTTSTLSVPTIVVGDLNAQIHPQSMSSSTITGPNTLPPQHQQDTDSPEQPNNSSALHKLCTSHHLCIPQTWMKKTPNQINTHRRPNGEEVQLDHILCSQSWKPMFHNITVNRTHSLNSNHYLLQAKLLIKRAKTNKKTPQSKPAPNPPTEAKEAFNQHLQSHPQASHSAPATDANASTAQTIDQQWEAFRDQITTGLQEHIPTTKHRAKQPWITEATFDLIEARNKARQAQNAEKESQLHKDIRRAAKKDKANWLKEQLDHSAQALTARDKWAWIKRLKKPYTGRSISLKNKRGEVVNTFSQADTFAEYLAHSHWCPPPHPYTGSTQPIHTDSPVSMNPVTITELQKILGRVKNHKAPGPDNIPAEAYKWMDETSLQQLATLFNRIISTGQIPQEWSKATVVEIYKGKGSHTDPEMYRPISLLSTAYKIFARVLQTRLEKAIDHKLRVTQFGFRSNRSTSQPIHIVRRLIENAEAHGDTLYSLFLDWEKAFDKIHPQALLTSLQRFGINQEYINIIQSIYDHPAFTVRAMNNHSTEHVSSSGIRQGCPLSPYLFLVVHSCIMHDVEAQMTDDHNTFLPTLHSQKHPLFDLAYADDTIILAKSAATTQRILHLIQDTAAQYNLKLNMGKCELLRTNASNPVYFKTVLSPHTLTGTTPPKQVQAKHQAKYLGVIITPQSKHPQTGKYQGYHDKDITARLQKGRDGFKKLHKFWRHTNIPQSWKMQVFRTVFVPMLTYGMESACLTQHNFNRLDAFQAQSLRKILNIKATYYTEVLDPTATTVHNSTVIQLAKMPTISQTITALQLKFLGHILRGSQEDLETQVCFTRAWVYRGGLTGDGLRKGLTKQHWLDQATKAVWNIFQDQGLTETMYSTTPVLPYSHLTLHRIAQDRQFWRESAKLPTCIAQDSQSSQLS